MSRIFSGIQPSGELHIGNYLGAVKNWARLQHEYETIICIVDYHALTSQHDPDLLRERTRDMAASLLALGLDPEKCTLFVQSHRPEHAELAWLLATVTPVSWLERTPTYKEKRQTQPDDINHGLLTYPVLQAADIAIYKAGLVPVGKDQAAHLELSREIVRAFNNRYGETFPEAEAVYTTAPVVLGTDGVKKMSKSVGNVVAPEEVIKKYGAEILRLWVAAQDYRDDIRISQEILTRLSEAYRRIRNTCKYILGNLSDFDPAKDSVDPAKMPEIDRWALHQLELLKEKVLTCYNDYEFHVLYHAVNGFCTVEMSSFYLDILKDRMYTSKSDSLERLSAQTVMYRILDTLLRLIAPVLSFTADEAWQYLPGVHESSVHLAEYPMLQPELKDDTLVERWDRIMKVRAEVSKALEGARVAKTIGHSLDARVTVSADVELQSFLQEYAGELASIFIVSKVELVPEITGEAYESDAVTGLRIFVDAAPGAKCERCWCYSEELGTESEHPTICPKCTAAVK